MDELDLGRQRLRHFLRFDRTVGRPFDVEGIGRRAVRPTKLRPRFGGGKDAGREDGEKDRRKLLHDGLFTTGRPGVTAFRTIHIAQVPCSALSPDGLALEEASAYKRAVRRATS